MSERAAASQATGPVIICYDGSDQAAAAIPAVANLMPGARAVVVTAWKPIVEALLTVSVAPTPLISDPAAADERQRQAAEALARDGARRASQAGLDAEPLAVEASGAMWKAIEAVARDRDARAIACGRRGQGVESSLPGSVATALVHNSSRPVLVVPSAERPPRRRERRSRRRVPLITRR